MESLGTLGIIAILFSFIIGVIFGGMAAFLSRRVMFTRQIRIAERKATRIMTQAGDESQSVLRQAREEVNKKLK